MNFTQCYELIVITLTNGTNEHIKARKLPHFPHWVLSKVHNNYPAFTSMQMGLRKLCRSDRKWNCREIHSIHTNRQTVITASSQTVNCSCFFLLLTSHVYIHSLFSYLHLRFSDHFHSGTWTATQSKDLDISFASVLKLRYCDLWMHLSARGCFGFRGNKDN